MQYFPHAQNIDELESLAHDFGGEKEHDQTTATPST